MLLMIHKRNLKVNTGNATSKSNCGNSRGTCVDSDDEKVEAKISIRPKRQILKLCCGIIIWSIIFLNINTIECISSESTTTTTPAPSTGGQYFTSIVEMKELARLEQSVIAEFKLIKLRAAEVQMNKGPSYTLWRELLSKMRRYIQDYNSSIRPMLPDTEDVEQVVKVVVSHPLIAYRMFRRVVLNLPEILKCNVRDRLKYLRKILDHIQPAVTTDDLYGAVEGILRLQTTFMISPYDFAHGRLHNFETKSGLTGMDCFIIGNFAIDENRRFSIGIEWIVQALRMLLQNEFDFRSGPNRPYLTWDLEIISQEIEMVRKGLRSAIEEHNIAVLNHGPFTFGKAIETNLSEMTLTNENELMTSVPSHLSPPSYQLFVDGNSYHDEINFNALCRGDKLRNETLTKNLKCYYKTDNPFLAIKPLKVEVHSNDPLIMQFYDFMPEYIMNHFINITSHRLKRALVTGTDTEGEVPSNQRIACNDWMDYEIGDKILGRVPQIIHEATGLNLMPEGAVESSQISAYGAIGGFYAQHYDTLHESRYRDYQKLDDAAISRGDRIATLTDLKLGGGTAFPKIGVVAQSIKGSAVFWFNLKENGQRHDHTLHGGCPVLLGEKWVVNKWIRSGDQMFIRKCSLDIDK